MTSSSLSAEDGSPGVKKVLILAGVVLVLLALVGGFSILQQPDYEHENVRELVAALEDAGIECRDLNVSPPDPAEDVVDFGSCRIDGRTVNLNVYTSEGGVARHVRGNVEARSRNVENYFTTLVAGENWVIDAYSEKTTRKIQDALGGSIH